MKESGKKNTENLADWSIVQDKENSVMDNRNVKNGRLIPTSSYSDQPYLIETDDGAWLCCVTTGDGIEGQHGQHIISMRSTDQGKTWEKPVDVEPADGPEASYSVLYKTDYGRIYIFYNYNHENIRQIKADNPPYTNGYCSRVDSMGQFVFKYSDDHGKSWSSKRYPIDVREFECDRKNVYGGKIRFFWNVGKPVVLNGKLLVSIHKVGGIGMGFFTSSEGALVASSNILTEKDPEKIEWITLPDGDVGLRTPAGGGKISEEQSYSVLSDGSLYCVYRSVDGHPVETYSRDGGHTWEPPYYKAYADGRLMKHPRAANFAWKCSNGKYLYWFHNHGGRDYEDRNPVWLSMGEEIDSAKGRVIRWSEPEVFLYDDDPYIRMSYPDLLESHGQIYISETQKSEARLHPLSDEYLQKLFSQFECQEEIYDHVLLDQKNPQVSDVLPVTLPDFTVRDNDSPDYRRKDLRGGMTFDIWSDSSEWKPGDILCENMLDNQKGFRLKVTEDQTLELILSDGQTTNTAKCDPVFSVKGLHHIGIVIDNGPKIVSFIVDGKFCDGGTQRQFGWSRYSPLLMNIAGSGELHFGTDSIRRIKVYDRVLMTSEIISNYRSGKEDY